MEKVVIDNKAGRRRAFFFPLIGLNILALIMGFGRFSVGSGELDKELFILAAGFMIAVIIGGVSGLVAVIKMPAMKITLNESDIEVVRGKARGTYLFEDFTGCRKQTVSSGRSIKTVYSLVFENEDGEELFIDCLGFDYYDVLGIADAISTSNHDDSEDVKDTLSGDRFTDTPETSDQFPVSKMIGFLVLAILIGIGTSVYIVYRRGFPGAIPFLIDVCIMAVVAVIFMIKLLQMSKRNSERGVREVVLDTYELKVNEKTWEYGKISKIYITPPYLTRVDEEDPRELIITGNDPEETAVFTVGKRPGEYDPSDEYTKLYNSITDLCGSKGIKTDLFHMPKKD